MKSMIKSVYNSSIGWNICKKQILNELCVPCYHIVSNKLLPHIENIIPIIDAAKFEKDIDFLGKNFDFITPDDLKDYLKNGEIPNNKCLLTFDDGYKECFEIIYPILKKKGVPAIFFLVKDLIDNKSLCHFNKLSLILDEIKNEPAETIAKNVMIKKSLHSGNIFLDISQLEYDRIELIDFLGKKLDIRFDDYLTENKPYMTEKQIIEMSRNGFSFGAHSTNHGRFTFLNKESQRNEIIESVKCVEKIINTKVDFFAFPYSSYGFNPELFEEFEELFFFDTFFGFEQSNHKIVQRFVTDRHEGMKSTLVETSLKKINYQLRFKKFPKISKLN